ncbi:MAG: hypothetical protein WCT14_08590 [Treponemataceae bacterium]
MYTVRFNAKSTASAAKTALKLSASMDGVLDGRMMVVENENLTRDMVKLVSTVGSIAHTEFIVDGREIDNPSRAQSIVRCSRIKSCTGECLLWGWRWIPLLRSCKIVDIQGDEPMSFAVNYFDEPGVILDLKEFSVDFSREDLLELYAHDHDDVALLCPKYQTTILEKLKALPEVIHIEWDDVDLYTKDPDEKLDQEEDELAAVERKALVMEIADEVEARLKRLLKL